MKFKIEVDIDYLGEDGSLDEQIQERIAQTIIEKVSKTSIGKIEGTVSKIMDQRVNEVVNAAYQEMMGKEITITDGWGDTVKSFPNAAEMIKSRFDTWLTEKVDDNGNKTSYNGQTRLDLIIKKQLDKTAQDFTKTAIKEVTEKIKTVLSDDLKLALGDRLINMMELDKIINNNKLLSK
jgi:hypothetical protein